MMKIIFRDEIMKINGEINFPPACFRFWFLRPSITRRPKIGTANTITWALEDRNHMGSNSYIGIHKSGKQSSLALSVGGLVWAARAEEPEREHIGGPQSLACRLPHISKARSCDGARERETLALSPDSQRRRRLQPPPLRICAHSRSIW